MTNPHPWFDELRTVAGMFGEADENYHSAAEGFLLGMFNTWVRGYMLRNAYPKIPGITKPEKTKNPDNRNQPYLRAKGKVKIIPELKSISLVNSDANPRLYAWNANNNSLNVIDIPGISQSGQDSNPYNPRYLRTGNRIILNSLRLSFFMKLSLPTVPQAVRILVVRYLKGLKAKPKIANNILDQIGSTIADYNRQAMGVYCPERYGTEFEVHVDKWFNINATGGGGSTRMFDFEVPGVKGLQQKYEVEPDGNIFDVTENQFWLCILPVTSDTGSAEGVTVTDRIVNISFYNP